MSEWIYQSVTEIELRQKGREAIEASRCAHNPNNIKMIEQLIYRLSLNEEAKKLNRKKYACLLQEFVRDTCELQNKTVNEVYLLYKEALKDPESAKIGWKSELFDEDREKEEYEITRLKTKIEIASGYYKCKFCGSDKTYNITAQLRSGDESSTDIVSCMNCYKTFRVDG